MEWCDRCKKVVSVRGIVGKFGYCLECGDTIRLSEIPDDYICGLCGGKQINTPEWHRLCTVCGAGVCRKHN